MDRRPMTKNLKAVKIKCSCGHLNLIPVYEVFQVFEPIRCENCGRVIAETKDIKRGEFTGNITTLTE